jgi:hypothetical protein
MADMALAVITAIAGIGVPIDRSVGRDMESRVAFLVEIFAILGFDGGSVAAINQVIRKSSSSAIDPEQPARGTSHAPDEVVLLYCGSANTVSVPPSAV